MVARTVAYLKNIEKGIRVSRKVAMTIVVIEKDIW